MENQDNFAPPSPLYGQCPLKHIFAFLTLPLYTLRPVRKKMIISIPYLKTFAKFPILNVCV